MKTKPILGLSVALAASVFVPACSTSQTAQEAEYTFELGYPTGTTAQDATDATDLRRAIEAYKFFFPTVATESVFQQFVPHGAIPNEVGIIMPQDPEQQFAYANQDTPYLLSVFDLRAGPMVIEIPEGPFIGAVDDHNQEWIRDNGLIGSAQGKGEKDLLLPPGYEGDVPEGFDPFYSKTWKVLWFVRVLSGTGSYEEALSYAQEVKAYPLSEADKPSSYRVIDIAGQAAPSPMLKWEKDMEYWRQLHKVIDEETVQERYRVMLGMLAGLGIEKGKPFPQSNRVEQILTKAAGIGFEEMRVSYFAHPRPEKIAWEGRNWEWMPQSRFIDPKAKEFGTENFRDLLVSDSYFWVGYGTSIAIGRREVGAGSMYFTTPRDASGAYLDGGKNYRLKVPGPVPASLFWSVTVYDSETRSIIDSGQGRGSVRSLQEKPQANADGSYDIFFGPDAPPAGKENQWVKTMPGKGWFTCVRMYGPQAAVFDGSYELPDIMEEK